MKRSQYARIKKSLSKISKDYLRGRFRAIGEIVFPSMSLIMPCTLTEKVLTIIEAKKEGDENLEAALVQNTINLS